jgi:hypothetical protein
VTAIQPRRGVYEIGDDELARLLRLPPGQRVLSVSSNWARLSLLIMVEGEGLPEVFPGGDTPLLNKWGRFRTLGDSARLDVSKLSPGAAHAAVLAELGAVRFEDPDALTGRRRILERHAPYTLPDVPDREGPWCSIEGTTDGGAAGGWPCEDYLDAAAGLVCGLPGQAEYEGATAAAETAKLIIGDQVMPVDQAQAILADPATGAALDAAVLGDQGAPTDETRPGVETERRRHRRTPPLDRPDQQEV